LDPLSGAGRGLFVIVEDFNGASFCDRGSVGGLSALRFAIEAPLALYRRFVLRSRLRWRSISASFCDRGSVGGLSALRFAIEAPMEVHHMPALTQ